ncbi:uncharacterized protein RSE6_13907 [Rhynchosporium secalis]|uniref:Uncharacterized protein n=1 Tax=Rhynchosporium secalis TaxID=38038 RepID=A0A1E1MU10_RHYSE|nr:uncharacterized protein RSE6_13907 [Rhynchosporium secalis]
MAPAIQIHLDLFLVIFDIERRYAAILSYLHWIKQDVAIAEKLVQAIPPLLESLSSRQLNGNGTSQASYCLQGPVIQIFKSLVSIDYSQVQFLRSSMIVDQLVRRHLRVANNGVSSAMEAIGFDKQWYDQIIILQIPPENIIELAVQCACSLMYPVSYWPLSRVRILLISHFGVVFTHLPDGKIERYGTPRVIYLAHDYPPSYTGQTQPRYYGGGSSSVFLKRLKALAAPYRTARDQALRVSLAANTWRVQIDRVFDLSKAVSQSADFWTKPTDVTNAEATQMQANVRNAKANILFSIGKACLLPGFEVYPTCLKCCVIYDLPFVGDGIFHRPEDCAEDAMARKVRGRVACLAVARAEGQ